MTATSDIALTATRPFRYTATLAERIESRWQERWRRDGSFHAPNPKGPLSDDPDGVIDRQPLFVMDMFPYPSGAGLHVGHPLGYIATDVFARYHRMAGRNVLHTMGFDAFGLPAEQYAVQTGQHPRTTTESNIVTMRRQLRRLGLGHDERRSFATIDVGYYRWTQWIFLQIYNAWYDAQADRARPIEELADDLASGRRVTSPPWAELSQRERNALIDSHRLVYLDEVAVNWCPGLGTVLSNEEVTAEGRSERGNFPVYRRPLKQWMMRITAYADRLLADLEPLDWPEPIKLQQRNWIGRSRGARIWFDVDGRDERLEVFTTRPDTLFGATFMVVSPEHPIVDALVAPSWPEGTPQAWRGGAATPGGAVAAYRGEASRKSEVERQVESRDKTGVFVGAYAVNPANDWRIPIFIADYVLMGYGSGAIMAVPGGDSRDFAFAQAFGIDIVKVVEPPADWYVAHRVTAETPPEHWPDAYEGADGVAVNSANAEVALDGLTVDGAKAAIIAWLETAGAGAEAITYKLRDWLFSRQRYWGEPFPIVFDDDDDDGMPHPLPDSMLPVELPEISDYAPRTSDDENVEPEPPLSRAADWVDAELDLGDGRRRYRRETNTMPNWAGSCWYYLRYLDPANDETFCDPDVQRYWMGDGTERLGGVDLYVGGVEQAVLHLLYARFWHKVLYDLGYVWQPEPFQRLYNQGYILAAAYIDERGVYVDADRVVETAEGFFYDGRPVTREFGKMGKSLRNSVTPDQMYAEYGADTLRLYEMYMGPLDASRPWDSKAIIGVHRFLQRVWRAVVDEDSGVTRVCDEPLDDASRRLLHRTIAEVDTGLANLRFNTSIARMIELTNHLTATFGDEPTPREAVEPLVLMLAPLAPHIAEELWERLGHDTSLVRVPFPQADPVLVRRERISIGVQINGKVRATVELDADADDAEHQRAALSDDRVARLLDGKHIHRTVVVPGRLISFVTD